MTLEELIKRRKKRSEEIAEMEETRRQVQEQAKELEQQRYDLTLQEQHEDAEKARKERLKVLQEIDQLQEEISFKRKVKAGLDLKDVQQTQATFYKKYAQYKENREQAIKKLIPLENEIHLIYADLEDQRDSLSQEYNTISSMADDVGAKNIPELRYELDLMKGVLSNRSVTPIRPYKRKEVE